MLYATCYVTCCIILLRDRVTINHIGRIRNERIANETNCKRTLCIYVLMLNAITFTMFRWPVSFAKHAVGEELTSCRQESVRFTDPGFCLR